MANKTYGEVERELHELINGSIDELSPLLGVPNEQRSRLYTEAILKMAWVEVYVVYNRFVQARTECRETDDEYSRYSTAFNNVISFIRDMKFTGFTYCSAEFRFAKNNLNEALMEIIWRNILEGKPDTQLSDPIKIVYGLFRNTANIEAGDPVWEAIKYVMIGRGIDF
jgi:hypothetical protein